MLPYKYVLLTWPETWHMDRVVVPGANSRVFYGINSINLCMERFTINPQLVDYVESFI